MTEKKIESVIRYPSDLIDEEWEILEPIFRCPPGKREARGG